ncbi:MAG: hypothetical protein KAV87_27210 [Desulfobacteraceae bacterium]|nr:hypothetical protein [Desulfobacteraceae bacterium]
MNAFSTSSLAASPNYPSLLDVDTCYRVIGDVIRTGQHILGSSLTDTASVQDASRVESRCLTEEEATYKDILSFAEQSEYFAFLDEPDEDIYGLDDGEPI